MAAIKTAVSIKSDKQVESCRKTIEQEVQNNGISLHLKEELLSVLQLAENGEWKQAEEKIREIQKRYIVDASTVQ
ncbi:MAG: hypothetical protein Q4C95_05180 [Planctomycetia bacterium]|nr:hypothetical protein [Planctomycetia bacterium]